MVRILLLRFGMSWTKRRGRWQYLIAVCLGLTLAGQASAREAGKLLRKAPGVTLLDDRVDGGYPTAVVQATGNDAVFVGRVREDLSHPNGLNLWIVSDNVRKGAALNSVQIAELLLKYLM